MPDSGEHTEIHAREGRPPDGQPIGVYVQEQPTPVLCVDTRGQMVFPLSMRGSVWQAVEPRGGGAAGASRATVTHSGGSGGSGAHLGYDEGRESLGQLYTAANRLQESLEAHEAREVLAEQAAAERGLTPQPHPNPSWALSPTGPELVRAAMEQAASRERARILAAGPHRRPVWRWGFLPLIPALFCALSLSSPWWVTAAVPAVLAAWWAVLHDRHWAAYRRACGCWACSASWWRHPFLRACLLVHWLEPPKRHGHGPRDKAWWDGLHKLEAAEGIEPMHDEQGNLLNTDDVELA